MRQVPRTGHEYDTECRCLLLMAAEILEKHGARVIPIIASVLRDQAKACEKRERDCECPPSLNEEQARCTKQ